MSFEKEVPSVFILHPSSLILCVKATAVEPGFDTPGLGSIG